MTTATVNEVIECFTALIQENQVVARELEARLQETEASRRPVQREYQQGLENFVLLALADREKNPGYMQKLNVIAGNGEDLRRDYEAALEVDRKKQAELGKLTAQHGDVDQLKDKVRAVNTKNAPLFEKKNVAETQVKKDATRLTIVDEFNTRAAIKDKPLMQVQSKEYFTERGPLGHLYAWMTDGHYREGRKLIKSFYKQGAADSDDIFTVQARLAANKKEVPKLESAIRANERAEPAVTAPIKEMIALVDSIQGEAVITERAKNNIVSLFSDTKKFNQAVALFSQQLPANIAEQRGKIEGYKKVEGSIQGNLDILKQASSRLAEPLEKLQKAVRKSSRNGTKPIEIDLGSVRASYEKLQKGSRNKAKSIADINKSIADFKFDAAKMDEMASDVSPTASPVRQNFATATGSSGYSNDNDFLTMYMHFMILDAVTNNDFGAVQGTLGIPESVSAGFNVSNIGGGLESVGSGIDAASIDTTKFDIPDTSVFDTGTFDTQNFNTVIDTVTYDNTPTYDPTPSYSDYSGGGSDGGGFSMD